MTVENKLIDDFITESREHIQKIQEDLIALERQPDNPDQNLIDKVFRSIHSVKGGAGFVNLQKIAELSHLMETLLQKIRQGEIFSDSNYIDSLLNASDLLKIMLDNVKISKNIDISETIQLFTKLINSSCEKKKLQKKTVNNVEVKKNIIDLNEFNIDLKNLYKVKKLYFIEFNLNNYSDIQHITPVSIIRDLLSMGEIIGSFFKIKKISINDDLINEPLILKILYSTDLQDDQLYKIFFVSQNKILKISYKKTKNDLIFYSEEINNENQIILDSEENQILIQPLRKKNENQSSKEINIRKKNSIDKNNFQKFKTLSNNDQSETIRINISLLDKLMNYASELVHVRNRLLLESDQKSHNLQHISQDLDMLTSELQETIMLTRMQPIGNIFARLPRIVRDLSKKLNKYIDIHISGNDVELDKNILESLADPLTHIVRNCCDHGIEKPDERLKINKPSTGTIIIKAYHKGGLINIEIKDDGKGINSESIKEKAIANSIISKIESERMSGKDIFSLIMTPGFSTAEITNDISGRGVGMDVVKTSIEEIGGSIEIDSVFGKGISFHICLPLTLAIIPSLIIQMDDEKFAVPQVNVEEIVRIYDNEIYKKIERSGIQEMYRLRDNLLPMVRLNEILKRPEKFTDNKKVLITESYHQQYSKLIEKNNMQGFSLIFAVVKVGSKKFGLIIDKMIGTEEIVVNALPQTIKSLGIYSGTTILGDGEVALVLDIDGISKHWGLDFQYKENQVIQQKFNLYSNDNQKILLFEYSKNDFFAIPLIMVKRVDNINNKMIKKMGQKIKKEYINYKNQTIFILRLDEYIDVPQVNSRQIKFLLMPKNTKTSIGLIFSSLKGITDMPQKLNTKDKIEGLLGTSIINKNLTLFVDIDKIIEKAEFTLFSKTKKNQSLIKKNILLVEDTDFFRQVIKGYLISEGYNVDIAKNGIIALELMKKKSFDLLISDIEMPEMGGWELIKRIRNNKKFKNIPAVAVTSLDSQKAYKHSLECGFDRHEIKIDKESLLKCISELL